MTLFYIKKKVAALLAILVASTATAFAEGYDAVAVKLTDGSYAKIVTITDKLTVTVDDTYVNLVSSAFTLFSAPITTVNSVRVIDQAGVNDITEDALTIVYSDSSVDFNGLAANTLVNVYNLAGQNVKSQKVSDAFRFNFSEYTPGTYIVSINNNSYKILVR